MKIEVRVYIKIYQEIKDIENFFIFKVLFYILCEIKDKCFSPVYIPKKYMLKSTST